MKKTLLSVFLLVFGFCGAQSLVQSVNSGSIISASSSVSVGEIVVNPVSSNQASSSGIIGILGTLSTGLLEVPELELTANITVYPNPTNAGLYFKSKEVLVNEKITIFNANGQLIGEKTINGDNGLDLSGLMDGIYLIQLSSDKTKTFKIIKH